MLKLAFPLMVVCIALTACAPAPTTSLTAEPIRSTETTATFSARPSDTPPPTETFTPIPLTETPSPTATFTETPVPTVESLNAVVATNILSCRYGPGSEYLYLDAFLDGLKITLIGQTGGNNWVLVKGDLNNCWVNIKFLNIEGDFKTLPVVYPEPAHIPMTSRYPPTAVISATRDGNKVTVVWLAVPVSIGDYEDENMFIYIAEIWRCEGGQLIFDPIASNRETVTFVDEPGCAQPSHGRIFVQEKHGYTRPAEITPWP